MRAHEEAVAAATARARQTAEDEARYRDLVAAGAVSASAYDKVKAAAESARAELNAAEGPGRRCPQRNELRRAARRCGRRGGRDAGRAGAGRRCRPGRRACGACRASRGGHRASRNPAPGDRIDRPRDLVWKRADGPRETSPVVGRRKPSDSDVRGSIRAGGPSGRRAAGLDHLHPDRRRPVRAGAAGTDRRDLRSGQGSRRMAGRRGNASGHVACGANRRPQRRSGVGRRRTRGGRSRRCARRASAARR